MRTGVLVDKGTYGPCIMVGDPLWSTGNSLSEKLLSSLVSVVAAWLCLSHTNWAAFASPLPSFCYLYNVHTYGIIKDIFHIELSILSYVDKCMSVIV